MPKIIIIEGPDNCGKDLLINRLKKDFNNIKIIHAGVPDNSNSLYDFYCNGIIRDTVLHYYDHSLDALIHNRSIYGEYVYGPKYRGESKKHIIKMIHDIEVGQIKTYIFDQDLCFILLTSDNVDLLVNNDDGKSISSKVGDIKDEINLFNEVFDLSIIKNKKKVFVNNGSNFRNKEDIYNEVKFFIDNIKGLSV
jgi:hypothetical protein